METDTGMATLQWPSQRHKRELASSGPTQYSYPFAELVDERTQSWPLVASPRNAAALLTLYLLMVRYAPKWMARHKPLQLRLPIFFYNLAMTLLNAHIWLELYISARALKYNISCQPCRVSYDPYELRMAAAFWWFYISKLLEFSDTLFFILRKKWSQLSFLHVYHHSTMFVLCWIIVKWIPTGSTFVPAIMNSFVHIIMYSYYALSTLGPRIQPFLWWKRYLTALQLLQFIIGLLWCVHAVLQRCEYQPWLSYTSVVYMISFLYLFGRFYSQKYTKAAVKCE
ncbi:elongation of very long chain fatty acids protein 4-like [Scaptodrosophila lebanonensis]|uniref:Elongation of very long chain fatty acids protein n=1 Tax=Drosophila lebanonensis TaxID=7225 RepID=A0A6J2UC54_DROLE|nr:elongation of very long chain fatty acids protein 4-like [Scaptodrosophila lebanonensis]